MSDDLVPDHEKAVPEAWRVILDRALEVDDSGRLCWRVVLLTVPRQSTKSTLAGELMAWRIHQAQRFGERQIAVHTAPRLQQASRIQEDMYAWARGAGLRVLQRTGQERIQGPDESRWEVQSLTASYGSRPGLAFVDEAFDVERTLVEKALLPAQARRRSPQLWLVSTANDEHTDLMPHYMALARAGSHRECLLDWGLPAGADADDPRWWPLCNPFPSAEYLAEVEANRESADWLAQWLNVWPERPVRSGSLLVEPESWAGWVVGPVGWLAAGVEASFGRPPVVVLAGLDEGGRVVVHGLQARSMADAAGMCAGVAEVRVGKSLLHDPVWQEVVSEKGGMGETSARAVSEFRRLVDDGMLRHTGQGVLDRQVLGLLVERTSAGVRVVSSGRVDAVKAAVWAARAARVVPESPGVF